MAISESRKAQIESHLAKHGITADETAINGVVSILKDDQRATVASACRRYAASVNPQVKAEQQPTGETANNATAPTGDKLQDTLSQLSNLLGDRLLEGVVSKAVERCNDRLLSGDWTINTDTQKKLENLQKTLDVEFQIVEENFLSLPSQTTSNNKLLPSSEEIFDNAVIGVSNKLEPIS